MLCEQSISLFDIALRAGCDHKDETLCETKSPKVIQWGSAQNFVTVDWIFVVFLPFDCNNGHDWIDLLFFSWFDMFELIEFAEQFMHLLL